MMVVPNVFWLTILAVAAFRSCATSAVSASCEDDVHLACTNKPFHDSLDDDGFSLLNEDMLDLHCSDILEDIECKRSYLSVCDPTGFESFALATDGVKNVLRDLCNDTTDLRKAFHTHSPCISSLTDIYEECIFNTVDVVRNDKYDYDGGDIASGDAAIQRMCSFYEPFKACATRNTRTICGDSAAQVLEQMIVRAASPAVDEKCPAPTRK